MAFLIASIFFKPEVLCELVEEYEFVSSGDTNLVGLGHSSSSTWRLIHIDSIVQTEGMNFTIKLLDSADLLSILAN